MRTKNSKIETHENLVNDGHHFLLHNVACGPITDEAPSQFCLGNMDVECQNCHALTLLNGKWYSCCMNKNLSPSFPSFSITNLSLSTKASRSPISKYR